MGNEAKPTHVAIPILIYQTFLDCIKSEKGITPESLGNVLLSAKLVHIEEEVKEITQE